MKNLFSPIVPENKLNPAFKKISSWPGSEPGRLMANYIFQNYNDKDGNFIEQFQTTGFDARIFELYLFALLSDSGYEIIQDYSRPDFLIRKNDITVAIEATTVNPSYGKDKADIETKISPEDVDIKHDHDLPIKFGSPLFSKLNKKYWELEHCKNLPIVLAIAFLLIPFMWMVSQVFVLVFVLFRDYFELVAFIIIIIMIIAMYFYIKYWR